MKLDYLGHAGSRGSTPFDLLVVCDVLEHVPDHLAAMREMYRVLAPGGCAIITVPQKDHLERHSKIPT